MTEQTQQEFLKAGKAELGVTWNEFAELAGIESRAFKTYRMPNESKDHRKMKKFVLEAVVQVLQQHRKKIKKHP